MTRALEIFDTVPSGHIVHAVHDRHCMPLLSPGEVAVITNEPQIIVEEGVWYLVEYHSPPSYSQGRMKTSREIVVARKHPRHEFWSFVVPAQVPGTPLAMADGPYENWQASQRVLGRVVGIYRSSGAGFLQIGEAA